MNSDIFFYLFIYFSCVCCGDGGQRNENFGNGYEFVL